MSVHGYQLESHSQPQPEPQPQQSNMSSDHMQQQVGSDASSGRDVCSTTALPATSTSSLVPPHSAKVQGATNGQVLQTNGENNTQISVRMNDASNTQTSIPTNGASNTQNAALHGAYTSPKRKRDDVDSSDSFIPRPLPLPLRLQVSFNAPGHGPNGNDLRTSSGINGSSTGTMISAGQDAASSSGGIHDGSSAGEASPRSTVARKLGDLYLGSGVRSLDLGSARTRQGGDANIDDKMDAGGDGGARKRRAAAPKQSSRAKEVEAEVDVEADGVSPMAVDMDDRYGFGFKDIVAAEKNGTNGGNVNGKSSETRPAPKVKKVAFSQTEEGYSQSPSPMSISTPTPISPPPPGNAINNNAGLQENFSHFPSESKETIPASSLSQSDASVMPVSKSKPSTRSSHTKPPKSSKPSKSSTGSNPRTKSSTSSSTTQRRRPKSPPPPIPMSAEMPDISGLTTAFPAEGISITLSHPTFTNPGSNDPTNISTNGTTNVSTNEHGNVGLDNNDIITDINDANYDDGVGLNGVGFRPTPSVAYARAQKRKQQIADWRTREAREERQRRSERRSMYRRGTAKSVPKAAGKSRVSGSGNGSGSGSPGDITEIPGRDATAFTSTPSTPSAASAASASAAAAAAAAAPGDGGGGAFAPQGPSLSVPSSSSVPSSTQPLSHATRQNDADNGPNNTHDSDTRISGHSGGISNFSPGDEGGKGDTHGQESNMQAKAKADAEGAQEQIPFEKKVRFAL